LDGVCVDRNHGDSSRHRVMLVFYLARRSMEGERPRTATHKRGARASADPGAKCTPIGVPFSDSKPFHLSGENISDASLGLDKLRCARIVLQFAAKAENLHIYAAIEHVFVDSSRL
jgi:hypothetical protein